ncbi:MAG TPA: nuclear transport factor 2 family protein [Miltoncostaeaceae bacterium]|nr:nuclear transport factor 2 family protein [Miltoncostaeaceae bacterium]
MTDPIEEQVLAANRAFYDAFEALDMERMAACWSSAEDVACLHPGGPWQRGWDEVREGWEAIMANTGYIEFEIAGAAVTRVDPVAWVTCSERITTAGAGGAPAVAEIAATNLFVLETTGWRIALHHASPVVRPAPAEA